MYRKIMVPVDLTHLDHLDKALSTAADLAQRYDAPICYVGVTATTPTEVAPTPDDYRVKLDAFAQGQAQSRGVSATSLALTSHDPTADLNQALTRAVTETGADLVVVATHAPNFADHLWPSHGGGLAAHTQASVFLVR